MRTTHVITGGDYALIRGPETINLTVDLHWVFYGGEPGSLSICDGYCLDRIRAYDDEGSDIELNPSEEDEIINAYGFRW